MSKGVMAAGIIMLGVLTFGLINIISNYTTGNELDFQLLRDTTESAMLDAVDLGFFQTSGGQIRMDKEKFVEGFVDASLKALTTIEIIKSKSTISMKRLRKQVFVLDLAQWQLLQMYHSILKTE